MQDLKENWKQYLENGFNLVTSGTTGTPKTIFQEPEKLKAGNATAIDSQEITSKSRVLTVCRMTHAGGTVAQTLPALSAGAHVDIIPFNAFSFFKDVSGYTHTHLAPMHCELLLKTKAIKDVDLTGLWITCGSDPVHKRLILPFVARGATYMCNWGMTEVGPCAINHVFRSVQDVHNTIYWNDEKTTILGTRKYCEYKIVEGALHVKGDIVLADDWFDTGDLVSENHGPIKYHGRR